MLQGYTDLAYKELLSIIERIKQVHRSLCHDKLQYKSEYYKFYRKGIKENFFFLEIPNKVHGFLGE